MTSTTTSSIKVTPRLARFSSNPDHPGSLRSPPLLKRRGHRQSPRDWLFEDLGMTLLDQFLKVLQLRLQFLGGSIRVASRFQNMRSNQDDEFRACARVGRIAEQGSDPGNAS